MNRSLNRVQDTRILDVVTPTYRSRPRGLETREQYLRLPRIHKNASCPAFLYHGSRVANVSYPVFPLFRVCISVLIHDFRLALDHKALLWDVGKLGEGVFYGKSELLIQYIGRPVPKKKPIEGFSPRYGNTKLN